jgi:hypothetical protein
MLYAFALLYFSLSKNILKIKKKFIICLLSGEQGWAKFRFEFRKFRVFGVSNFAFRVSKI